MPLPIALTQPDRAARRMVVDQSADAAGRIGEQKHGAGTRGNIQHLPDQRAVGGKDNAVFMDAPRTAPVQDQCISMGIGFKRRHFRRQQGPGRTLLKL